MKLLGSILIAVLAFTASALARGGDEFTLKVGQQKTSKSSKLRIKFVSVVEDSRCPKDVDCVWAGNAKVKVLVSNGQTKQELVLNTTLGPQGDRFDIWSVRLISLTPLPTSKGAPSARSYVAKFSVERLTRSAPLEPSK